MCVNFMIIISPYFQKRLKSLEMKVGFIKRIFFLQNNKFLTPALETLSNKKKREKKKKNNGKCSYKLYFKNE